MGQWTGHDARAVVDGVEYVDPLSPLPMICLPHPYSLLFFSPRPTTHPLFSSILSPNDPPTNMLP